MRQRAGRAGDTNVLTARKHVCRQWRFGAERNSRRIGQLRRHPGYGPRACQALKGHSMEQVLVPQEPVLCSLVEDTRVQTVAGNTRGMTSLGMTLDRGSQER